ncbi:MAG: ankyrin repeat domain-containing protein, partial [Gammaproteobacteria bacterium]|nr:ankyrin repeat domain-containing protein [Gammaproteobacteria bacterium]
MSSSHIDSKLPSELLPPNSLSDQLLENALVFLFKTKGGSGGRHREEIFHEFATQFKILLQEIYKRLKIDPARAVDIPEYDLNALGFVVLMVRDLRKAIEINREAYKNFPHELQVCVEFLTHINLNPDEKEFCNLHDITNFFVLMHGLNLLDGAIQQFVQHPTETDASSSTSAEMRRISPSAYIRSKIKVATTQVNEWDSLESKAYMTQAFVRETLSAYSARPPKGMVMLRDQWRLMRDKSSFSIICASVTVTLSRLLITGNGRSEDMQKFYKFFTRLWVESSSDFSFFYRDNIFGSLRGEPCFPDRPTLSPRRSLILQNLTGFNQDLKNKIHFYRQALTQLAANHQLYCDVPSLETALKTGSLYPGIHHTEFLAEKLLSRLPSGFFPAHWTFCSLSPLMIDAFLGDSKFVSDELNTKTTNIVAKNKFGATALHLTRDPMIACQIVFAAPDLSLFSIVDEDGYTPLMRAIQREDEAMVEILLKLGSNPNESSPKHGRTSLMVAAQSTENPRIIELLCEHGANVKVTNAEPGIPPKNAFSYAIMAGNISAMATLLACKGTKALPPLSQSVISTVSASHAVAAAIVSETSPEQDELIKLSRGNKHHFQRLLNVLTPPPGTPTQSNQKDAFELAIKRGYTTGKLIIKAALEQLNPTSNGDYAPDTEHQNHGAAELKSDTAPITPPMRPSSAAPARDDLPSMRHFAESLQKALETYKVRRGGDESQSYMALETFLRHLQCYLNSDNRLYRNPEKLLKKLDSALNQRGFLGLHPDSMGVLLANELGYFFDTKRIPLLR